MIEFEHTYADRLPAMSVPQAPVPVADPTLVVANQSLAQRLGVSVDHSPEFTALVAGNAAPERSVAQVYAGHQFGSYNPQLGDGRQIVLGEVVAPDGERFDIALKGSGRTPFSRSGDGRAALGPVLREYLMGEAMEALGVPTTRALAAVTTGELVHRQFGPERGAVLTRVAASHLRVGTFQWAAAQRDPDLMSDLIDYALWRHPPSKATTTEVPALRLLQVVIERHADLVARWMHLGFIHGVMNTDNTSISGETIDYGPCAFMEGHSPDAVFSSIDRRGRYRYRHQPQIALWNLSRLAEALLPHIDPDPERSVTLASAELDRFSPRYQQTWLGIARYKLGAPSADRDLVTDFYALLATTGADHTLAWRHLIDAAAGNRAPIVELVGDTATTSAWLDRWDAVRAPNAADQMRRVNPIYIPRNHLVEHALGRASDGDLDPFHRLLEVITHPYDEAADLADYARPAPTEFTEQYVTFCGT